MANSKIIIVEGPQGVGKTTMTDFIRNSLSYTNLYRLCGTSDVTKTGKAKAVKMYDTLLDYIKNLENTSVNLLLIELSLQRKFTADLDLKITHFLMNMKSF